MNSHNCNWLHNNTAATSCSSVNTDRTSLPPGLQGGGGAAASGRQGRQRAVGRADAAGHPAVVHRLQAAGPAQHEVEAAAGTSRPSDSPPSAPRSTLSLLHSIAGCFVSLSHVLSLHRLRGLSRRGTRWEFLRAARPRRSLFYEASRGKDQRRSRS